MSNEEIAPSADADDTTLATTAVNSEGDDFATHVEKLIHSKKTETPSLLLDLRASLATPSDRLEGAEKMKLEANASLSAGTAELALRSYLTALWLLRLDDPPLPAALGAQQLPSGASLLPALGAGADAAGEGTSDAAPAVAAARATLRLNLAQCALKLGDWPLARAACELVLEREPVNAKALYRLARAHEGTGELGDAIRVLSGRLLAAEPSHAERRELRLEVGHCNWLKGLHFDGAATATATVDGIAVVNLNVIGRRGGRIVVAVGLGRRSGRRRRHHRVGAPTPRQPAVARAGRRRRARGARRALRRRLPLGRRAPAAGW